MERSIWFVLDVASDNHAAFPEQLVGLAQRLRAEDALVTMVFSAPLAPEAVEALESNEVDVRILDFQSPRAPFLLLLWFHEYRPDIVHFHLREPRPSFVAAAKVSGAATLVQDAAAPPARALSHRAREMALDLFVDIRVEVHGAVSLSRFEGRDGSRVREELGIGQGSLVVAIAPDDGSSAETLLRALSLLEPDVHLAVVGARSDLSLRALANRLGIAPRVHVLGDRADVEDVLAAASVVVVAPDVEAGFDGVAIEGMAASRPVIVSRTGALPSLLGEAGLVVPQRDPASLGLAIRTVLADPEHGRRLGRMARKRVEENYSADAATELLMKTYRRIFLRGEPKTGLSKIFAFG